MDYSYPLLCACERYPSRTALIGRHERLTYAELEQRTAQLAGGILAAGLGGAKVGLLMNNHPVVVEVYMALARTGCIAVPLNTRLSAREQQEIADDAGLDWVVADDEELQRAADVMRGTDRLVSTSNTPSVARTLQQLRELGTPFVPSVAGSDERPATITYTSGTTGKPKGVVRTHRANAWNVVNSALGSPRAADDVELFNLPAFGIGFLHFLMPALLAGATVVLDEVFDPGRAWELIEEHRVTRTFLAPTMIAAMLDAAAAAAAAADAADAAPRDTSSLRVVYTAYAFPARARARAIQAFGHKFVYMYGLTEAQLTCASADDFETDPANVGRAMGASRIGIFDGEGQKMPADVVGEIGFAGPSVMEGYYRQPDETSLAKRGEWVLTGDLGVIDSDGTLRYLGRSKEIIKTGGFSVDPVEVENVILDLPGVAEAAVVGVPDEYWGEAVVAFATGDWNTVDYDSLRAFCRERISSFKVPKALFVLDELPKNAAGKIERGKLRQLASDMSTERGAAGTSSTS